MFLRKGILMKISLIVGAAAMIGLQLLFVYAPFMNLLFTTAPVPPASWLEAILIALAVFGIVDGEKWLQRRAAAGAGNSARRSRRGAPAPARAPQAISLSFGAFAVTGEAACSTLWAKPKTRPCRSGGTTFCRIVCSAASTAGIRHSQINMPTASSSIEARRVNTQQIAHKARLARKLALIHI